MRIAMIGTRGVPARYGGFETAVEEIGSRLVEGGHEVVVYCRGKDRSPTYRGMQRVPLPALRHPILETLSHTRFISRAPSAPPLRCGNRVQRCKRAAAAGNPRSPHSRRRARRRTGSGSAENGARSGADTTW